jgi:hypothetical protein
VTYREFEYCIEICAACSKDGRACVAAGTSSANGARCVRACHEAAIHCELFIADLRTGSPLLVHSSRMCAHACQQCAECWGRDRSEASQRRATKFRRCAQECLNVRVWLGQIQFGERTIPASQIARPPRLSG